MCIVFRKAMEAKVVRMGGASGVPTGEQSIVLHVDLGEMKYECVGMEGQKLASRVKVWSSLSTPTPDFEYSPKHFSKKCVFHWRLIISIHSNGLPVL